MKIVKSIKESDILVKGVNEKIEHEAKEQKDRFPGMLSGTVAATMQGNILAVKPKIPGGRLIRPGKGVI